MTVEFVSQSVSPKNIYVGDRVEVRCNFTSSEFFLDEGASYEFDLAKILYGTETAEYSVEQAILFRSQNQGPNYSYTLSLLLQPWTTGTLKLLPFELGREIARQVGEVTDNLAQTKIFSAVIYFEPLEVLELATGNDTAIRGTDGPLLVPGSLYFVYGAVAALFLFMLGVAMLLVKFKGLYSSWQNFWAQLYYKKNYKLAVKKLKSLLSEKYAALGDKDFCQQTQGILRKYLSVKYAASFESTVTSKIMALLLELTADTLSESKTEAAEKMMEVLGRADHVRYAENTGAYAPLQHGERQALIGKCLDALAEFEV